MHGNALRQYLNSVDLRIIKSIEDDTGKLFLSTDPMNQSANDLLANQTTNKGLFFTSTTKSSKKLIICSSHQSKES